MEPGSDTIISQNTGKDKKRKKDTQLHKLKAQKGKNIATGETSQAITPLHFFDNFNFHH